MADAPGKVLLSDMQAQDCVAKCVQVGGTWAWAAPEVLLGKRSTTQADIYSFGVVIWELVTGEQPVRGNARDVLVPAECPAVSVL